MKESEKYIEDYITGEKVRATPEEVEAVQVFSKQLVEDYGYSKDVIKTHPQWRVKARPSDKTKEYPVDIAVFKNKDDDSPFLIVECKHKNKKDGLEQLKDYLRFSKAHLGVWFNGDEREFLKKIEEDGSVKFEQIPNIPEQGQRVEDIGKFKRKDLKAPHNLKTIFKVARNHLAGNAVGVTRDEELAEQMINLILCKIYDERFTKPEQPIKFRSGIGESSETIADRIKDIFESVKSKYSEVIDFSDGIKLDDDSVAYVVGELQNYAITDAQRDAVADAFETFIGGALKGAQGQFFTPRNVVELMVEIADPEPDELIFDPACGSGGFLVESLRHIWGKLDQRGEEYGWSDMALIEEKQSSAMSSIHGLEKDEFLSKVSKAYMAIVGDGKSGIFCEDSLERPEEWSAETKQKIGLDKFDLVLTNPPFGKDIRVTGEDKLKQYDLAYKWRKGDERYEKKIS